MRNDRAAPYLFDFGAPVTFARFIYSDQILQRLLFRTKKVVELFQFFVQFQKKAENVRK